MRKKVCCEFAIDSPVKLIQDEIDKLTFAVESPIKLIQNGIDKFTVTYGQQIKSGLNYGDAAKELGCCIMHALSCVGKLDNRERGEK